MAFERRTFDGLRAVTGAGTFLLGCFLLSVHFDTYVARLGNTLGISLKSGGLFPATVLAVNSILHEIVFNHSSILSSAREILVSCWPVGLAVIGAVLLRSVFVRTVGEASE